MNIKSLLLGSAAALAAVSGAHAADAIVAAEPEAVEYVRVCDAYGTGYFYIPGTETCLKINGYVRFDVNYGFGEGFDNNGGEDWNVRTRAQLQFTSKSDTEYGPLTGVIVYQYNYRPAGVGGNNDASLGGAQNAMFIDQAYIDIAGLRVGTMLNWWDNDFSSEFDVTNSGTTRFNTIRYQYETSDFYAGIAAEEITGFAWQKGNNNIGIDAAIGGKAGSFTYELLAGYDVDAEEGAVRAKIGAAIGPGTLGLAAIYSTGRSAYFTKGEWSVATQYAVKATDKFTITPGVQYIGNIDLNSAGDYDSGHEWRAGVTLDYQIVENLSTKFAVNYISREHEAAKDVDYVQGFFRLQRAF
ncbi:porin [Rhizobium sp. OAE497]|uniref:porin n=1 Tax=Rhizobium sp. OAE497 TaxID=2663796 RepID=UPI0018F591EB